MPEMLFKAQKLPVLQNRVFCTREEALESATGDVELARHEVTGLIYNRAFDPSALLYDDSYQNEQACSGIFQRHLDDVANLLERRFRGKSFVEIGCGKGYFLDRLSQRGFKIVGVDPAYEGENPAVVREYFSAKLELPADVIILRHVLEHVQDPVAFLAEIARSTKSPATVYIEVPCLEWICRNRAWFDIYYEHVNYFTLHDLSRLFGRVHESGHLFGGQYLYVVADLESLLEPVAGAAMSLVMPDNFTSSLDRAADLIRSDKKRRNIIWGAASKGVIFALSLLRAGCRIDDVVDINPAKQGRYLPVTGLQVSSPENALNSMSAHDNIFVMNSRYLQEIVELSGNKYTYITVDHEEL